MKKLLTISFLLALTATTSFKGFSQAFKQGDKLLNAGIGLNSYYGNGLPIGASFEVGITEAISVGGQVDYNSGSYGGVGYNWGYTALYFGGRGSYHLNEVFKINNDKLDTYAGIGLGFQSFKWSDASFGAGSAYGSGVYFNYFVGGRYMFANSVGAFLELGSTGFSNVRAGVTLKF